MSCGGGGGGGGGGGHLCHLNAPLKLIVRSSCSDAVSEMLMTLMVFAVVCAVIMDCSYYKGVCNSLSTSPDSASLIKITHCEVTHAFFPSFFFFFFFYKSVSPRSRSVCET